MNDLRREIVTQVAAGTITAEEGAARLEALETPATPAPTPAPAAPITGLKGRFVKVISQFGSTRIVGDPSVAFAVADGPHRARQEGDTVVIEHQPFDEDDSFAFGPGAYRPRIVLNGTTIARRNLTVRMNPDLALTADVQAGNVRVDGVHGPITGEVQAGNFNVSDFRGTLNL